MRLKHYLVALLCLFIFSNCISQPLSVVSAQDNADYDSSDDDGADETPFECDKNALPEGLCEELEETFATDGFWKAENQQALMCITKNCRPGLDLGFYSCTKVGFGQRCEGVEISDDDPQVWSPDIKAESEDGLSNAEHHKQLVIRALGFSKMVGYLAKEAIHNSNKDFDAASNVYNDENLERQIEEAKQQENYYDNINFREVSRKAVCDDPNYKGDVQQYLYDEFYMDERYLTAINVAGNGFNEILDGGSNAKKVFSKGAINDRGRLRSGKLCRGDSQSFTLPSDELLETVSAQTDSMMSKGLIDEVGKITRDGKKALKIADDLEDNLAVQCRIQESQMEYILGAVSSNDRFMKTSSKASYCGDLGRNGCSLPDIGSMDQSCKTSYEKSMDTYLSNYIDGDEFDREQYIDPTTGRLKTNTKELLTKQLNLDKEKQYAEAQSKSEYLADAIEIRARFSAIMDLLEAEIGNNSWFFKPGQKIMTSSGGREIDDEDVSKIKKLPIAGENNFEPSDETDSSKNSRQGGAQSSPDSKYPISRSPSTGPNMQTRLAGLPKHSSSEGDYEDYDGINLTDSDSRRGYVNFGQGEKSTEDLVTNNPIYTDNSERNNLIHFPDEIIYSGLLSDFKTGVGFCTPSIIRPIDNDPNCRCVKGPLLRTSDGESIDQVFKPCPGDEDYGSAY